MSEKVVGILGGMGPAATCDLFSRIIAQTNAKSDADHIHVIIDSNCKIPDRTKAILYQGVSPLHAMIKSARQLESIGAGILIIPCITAHYYIESLQQEINIPIVNALQLIDDHLKSELSSIKAIGVLATSGTKQTQLLQRSIQEKALIFPDPRTQEHELMDIIYGNNGIKAGNQSPEVINRIVGVIDKLKQQGAEGVLAGCTEISLVLKQSHLDLPLIDPLDLLAQKSIDFALPFNSPELGLVL
ncbi:aspartate racemase [Alkaliphilus metalliredigens QYMF]|uniref:Aspartate racemase n=1 Tax=Alkaliphilus metalliredigens (strain QYMF) TaxID=293826 RepID=A6TVW8_ALKMQ|nr:amino acid racemase [Alkaliphilus metalliredigens]ABR50336.1 aspartate racemase [Alkaliphilus metalliredigens QYMF]